MLMAVWLCAAGCSQMQSGAPREFMGLPLLVVEDFDEPSDRWEPTDPKAWAWTQDGERTVYAMISSSAYKPEYRSPEGISLLEDVCVSDFVMDAWVRSVTKNYAHRDMCFFFGYQDPSHFYYVHFGLKSDDASNTIHIVNGAPRTPIVKTRTDGTPWSEDYHHVRIVRKVGSGLIEAYFDDMEKPAMTAEDRTFKWGRVGVGSFDDMGNIDRLVLWGRRVTENGEPIEDVDDSRNTRGRRY
jgi:hypothetical protein